MLLYQSDYQQISFENSTLYQEYFPKSFYMKPDEFQKESLIFLGFIQEYLPTFIINNLTEFGYTVSPDEQDWLVEQTKPIYEACVKKIATVLPQSIYSQVSVEQFIEDSQTQIPLQYFENLEQAKQWIYS